jgi:hypothetical protein
MMSGNFMEWSQLDTSRVERHGRNFRANVGGVVCVWERLWQSLDYEMLICRLLIGTSVMAYGERARMSYA